MTLSLVDSDEIEVNRLEARLVRLRNFTDDGVLCTFTPLDDDGLQLYTPPPPPFFGGQEDRYKDRFWLMECIPPLRFVIPLVNTSGVNAELAAAPLREPTESFFVLRRVEVDKLGTALPMLFKSVFLSLEGGNSGSHLNKEPRVDRVIGLPSFL